MRRFKTFYEEELTTEVPTMNKISHIQDMNVKQLEEFLDNMDYEISSKVDGSNISFGVSNGKVYIKSKSSRPVTDPEHFSKIAIDAELPILQAFTDTLNMLNANGFKEWHDKKVLEYKTELDKESNDVRGITLFGEVLNSAQVNTLKYDAEKIGKITLVPIGIKINDGTKEGVDISAIKTGKDILADFIEDFNGKNEFNIYPKHVVDIKLDTSKLADIKDFIRFKKDSLTSKKRVGEEGEQKKKDKAELTQKIAAFKKDLLDQIQNTSSFLGGTEIEGVVIRNRTNGITKIVDTNKFTAQNTKNWSERHELKKERATLYREIINLVGKDADILTDRDKQVPLITDKVGAKASRTDILKALYKDINDEIGFDDENIKVLKDKLNEYQSSIKDKLANLDTTIDPKNMEENKKALENEIEHIDTVLSRLNEPARLFYAIEFLLGRKQMNYLEQKFQ